MLVEDEVVKSVRFEDQYKILCETINELQKHIAELELTIEQKGEVIEQKSKQYEFKIEEIRVL